MRKFKFAISQSRLVVPLWCVISLFVGSSYAEDLQMGNQYSVIRPMYLMAVYKSLNNRTLSRETARAYLGSAKNANRSWMAFQDEVPVGTVITIIDPVPKKWYLPWGANKYFVRLDPDLSRGLDVVLKLNREIEGDLDGLNPELFGRVKKLQ